MALCFAGLLSLLGGRAQPQKSSAVTTPAIPVSNGGKNIEQSLLKPQLTFERALSDEVEESAVLETVLAAQAKFAIDGSERKVLHKQRFKCHRAAPDKASKVQHGQVMKKPKRTKKAVACTYVEEWVVFEDEPEMVYVFELSGHCGHLPGDAEDMQYFEMDPNLEQKVKEVSVRIKGIILNCIVF